VLTKACGIACVVAVALLLAADASATSSATPVGGLDCNANATLFRGKRWMLYLLRCPRNGTAGGVYGTGVYTDDSKVCSAAVHKGLITLAAGGTVTIKILPGRATYLGSTRNGITSSSYGSWPGSYSFVVTPRAAAPIWPILDGGRTWSSTATPFQTKTGSRSMMLDSSA